MKTQITLTLTYDEMLAAATEHYRGIYKDAEVTVLADKSNNKFNIKHVPYSFEDIKHLDPVRYGPNKIQNIKDFREHTKRLTGFTCGLAYAKTAIENWIEFEFQFKSHNHFPLMFKGTSF